MDFLYEIKQMPAISSHEHIGSLASIGMEENVGFYCDMIPGREAGHTNLFDLIFSPYFGGLLQAAGYCSPFGSKPKTALDGDEQQQLWNSLTPFLATCRGTGLYIALDTALTELHGVSLDKMLDEGKAWQQVSESITAKYEQGMYCWSKEMFEKAGLVCALKPVHLSYVAGIKVGDADPACQEEHKLFVPIYRVDDLLGTPDKDGGCDWNHAEEVLDMQVKSLEDVHRMVERTFSLVENRHIKAIKQLQAYMRILEFKPVESITAAKALEQVRHKNPAGILPLQDYIMGLILEKACRLKLPYQIHTGMANLPASNPAWLTGTIQRHPEVDFVLLHCYPYLSEAAYMARTYRNVYLDTAWLALQSPQLLYRALHEWLGFVPYSKICLSTDATSVEECYGAMCITREVLSRVLKEKVESRQLNEETAMDAAKALLHDNSQRLYRLGC